MTRHFGWERQIGFSRPEGKISLRKGSSHELSRCAWVRLALMQIGLDWTAGGGFEQKKMVFKPMCVDAATWVGFGKGIFIFWDRVAGSLHALLCAPAGPLYSVLTSSLAMGEGTQAWSFDVRLTLHTSGSLPLVGRTAATRVPVPSSHCTIITHALARSKRK